MLATSVDRTMQSGYSELMGLAAAAAQDIVSETDRLKAVEITPFKLRDADGSNKLFEY